ncbi:uncharacterized protein LOC123519904 isoform X3 [Portunus trituberculatus]|uniref:uncharacterized protein LOC123519904 isoform X3 n=1 Tax=Portunus trituberculatus TaxID=210409 RepID=UPI001E1CC00A|nr:uncharacterized protein LOC123519904 isoform X3 [Portunus trituberculatus]
MRIALVLVLSSLLNRMAVAVTIVRLSVPRAVEANTTAVVLDCDFQVHEWERPGLVLKWYMNKVHLVYQWIPPRAPQALGVMAGRIDTTFTVSRDPWAAYRALYIPRPHPMLSGQYSCTVSTFEDEDTESAHFLVWKAPRRVELKYWRPSEHLVNITCHTSGAAPRPKFTLFTHDLNGTNKQDVGVRGQEGMSVDGLWQAGAWGLIAWAETPAETVVGCTLTLPGTKQTHTTTRAYYPDLPILTTTTTEAATVRSDAPNQWANGSRNSPGAATSFFASSGRSELLSSTCCGNWPMYAHTWWRRRGRCGGGWRWRCLEPLVPTRGRRGLVGVACWRPK